MIKTYCKVVGGVVVDRAIFDGSMPEDWPDRELWQHSETAQIGWTYANGVFTGPAPAEAPQPSQDPNDYQLNRVQFRFMIEWLNIGPQVDAALNAMADGTEEERATKIMARVLYDDGTVFIRSHQFFTQLAPAVGVTSDQINAAWMQAVQLTW